MAQKDIDLIKMYCQNNLWEKYISEFNVRVPFPKVTHNKFKECLYFPNVYFTDHFKLR